MRTKSEKLASWASVSDLPSVNYRPERQQLCTKLLTKTYPHGLAIYGAGRNYGDQAFNAGGHVLHTHRLNRILAWDSHTGHCVCEPGVQFLDLYQTLLPQGWMSPVVPGTLMATIGGAVANDVHGKNHHRYGSFGQHVLWIELLLPGGQIIRASKTEHADLFAATMGGCGLTGLIIAVSFQCMPAKPWVQVNHEPHHQLANLLDSIMEATQSADFIVAWLDPQRLLTSSILTTAMSMQGQYQTLAWPRVNIPFRLPFNSVNSLASKLANACYKKHCKPQSMPLANFLSPLDSIGNWHYAYGPKGFLQCQCVIPLANANEGVTAVLTLAQQLKPQLAVIKYLQDSTQGDLSFATAGISIALDFPAGTDLHALQNLIIKYKGRVYLAKDATLTPEQFRIMYPKHVAFCKTLNHWQLKNYFQTDMQRRLRLGDE